MKTLAIVHTSFALVDMFGHLAKEILPGVKIVNIVDDDLLPYAREHGIDDRLRSRMLQYFNSAVGAGADLILNACSTVGETVEAVRDEVSVDVVKVDEPMAEEAVRLGERVGILATVESTLGPTERLIAAKAAAVGREVRLDKQLCKGAFEKLIAGDKEGHDAIVTERAVATAKDYDVIVLAQASMSRLGQPLTEKTGVQVLTSPELAFRDLARRIGDLSTT